MSELRMDPLTGRWVIIAGDRKHRPTDFRFQRFTDSTAATCPFCPGHEGKTPPEVYSQREEGTGPDSPGWHVRVVPNKFPALSQLASAPPTSEGHVGVAARGFHEVIIHSPHHDNSLGRLSEEETEKLVTAFRDRICELGRKDGIAHVTLIINHGREAGASLAHPHAQLFALPIIPENIAREIELARNHREKSGKCLLCSVIETELREGRRIVIEEDGFVIYAPYASGSPFEMLLAPKNHSSNFEELTDEQIRPVARALRRALATVDRALDDPPYNIFLHSGPTNGGSDPDFHWHFEIVPRLSTQAGFEMASGININTVAPEQAAYDLRGKG